jgi:hypothetical protein
MNEPDNLPPRSDRYYTVSGSGKSNDYTALALFETPEGKRDAVIGIRFKDPSEVQGFVAYIADKFGIRQKYKVAIVELPMIYWQGGTFECDYHIIQAINLWVDVGDDPSEVFYDSLEELDFCSFYSDFKDAVDHPQLGLKYLVKSPRKKGGKGFG